MKVLLVEDDPPKRDSISTFICENFQNIEMDFAASVNSATRLLEDIDYEFVIMDMSLPNFDSDRDSTGGRPINYGGEDLIDYIDKLGLDTKVIFITQYARFKEEDSEKNILQIAQEISQSYPDNYADMIYYNSSRNDWKQSLLDTIKGVLDAREELSNS